MMRSAASWPPTASKSASEALYAFKVPREQGSSARVVRQSVMSDIAQGWRFPRLSRNQPRQRPKIRTRIRIVDNLRPAPRSLHRASHPAAGLAALRRLCTSLRAPNSQRLRATTISDVSCHPTSRFRQPDVEPASKWACARLQDGGEGRQAPNAPRAGCTPRVVSRLRPRDCQAKRRSSRQCCAALSEARPIDERTSLQTMATAGRAPNLWSKQLILGHNPYGNIHRVMLR